MSRPPGTAAGAGLARGAGPESTLCQDGSGGPGTRVSLRSSSGVQRRLLPRRGAAQALPPTGLMGLCLGSAPWSHTVATHLG